MNKKIITLRDVLMLLISNKKFVVTISNKGVTIDLSEAPLKCISSLMEEVLCIDTSEAPERVFIVLNDYKDVQQ